MPSRFLPRDFNPERPVAVIAGRAIYPALMIEAMRRLNVPCRIVAFEGETMPELFESFPEEHRAMVKVGQIGKSLKALQRLGAGYAVMAGQITPRKLFRGLHPDLKAIQILAGLKERNAETIFSALAREIEAVGVRMIDARAFFDDQLARPGLMTRGKLAVEREDIEHGILIAREMARLDVGQGCVVCKGTVLAVEAFEGTDPMLKRAGGFHAQPAIFVKTVKPEQDYRFDVPVFGMRTLDVMAESGIKVAALEADKVIILEREKVIETANKQKIQIYGFPDPAASAPAG